MRYVKRCSISIEIKQQLELIAQSDIRYVNGGELNDEKQVD